MKMNYLLLIVACMFLASVQVGFAQCLWTEASGDIYRNTGKVGIGTTSPNALIEARSADGTANHITAIISNDAEEGDALLEFQEFEGGDRGRIGSITSSSPNRFVINPTGNVDTTINEGGGKVGIGTTSPSTLLELESLSGTANFITAIIRNDAEEGDALLEFQEFEGGDRGRIGSIRSSSPNRFVINPTGNVDTTINEGSGKVGIGTDWPAGKLHVQGDDIVIANSDDHAQGRVFFKEFTDTTQYGFSLVYNGDNSDTWCAVPPNCFGIVNHYGSDQATVVITRRDTGVDSNVGIGTSNPQRKLHIEDVMRLEPRSSAPSNAALGDLYVNSNGKLYFYNGSAWKEVVLQ